MAIEEKIFPKLVVYISSIRLRIPRISPTKNMLIGFKKIYFLISSHGFISPIPKQNMLKHVSYLRLYDIILFHLRYKYIPHILLIDLLRMD